MFSIGYKIGIILPHTLAYLLPHSSPKTLIGAAARRVYLPLMGRLYCKAHQVPCDTP